MIKRKVSKNKAHENNNNAKLINELNENIKAMDKLRFKESQRMILKSPAAKEPELLSMKRNDNALFG